VKRLNDPFAPTPEGFHLRVEQTLNGLEEREMTKRKFTASLAVVLALVILMAAAAVAGVSGGYVGWDGIIHYYDDDDATVEPIDHSGFEKDENYNKYLQTIPRGECWIVTKDGEVVDGLNSPADITDERTFRQLIEGSGLPAPFLPGGYQLSVASIVTDCEETPYSERTLDDGAVLSKYKLKEPVVGEFSSYCYHFCAENPGNVHYIEAAIVPASDHLTDDVVMYLTGNETAEAVKVEGFEYGLYVESPDGYKETVLMHDMGDKMLRILILAFDDLPKEAVLNLFNPEGNIDLSSRPVPARADSGVDFELVPEGEYWIAVWPQNTDFRESAPNDRAVADFDEMARLSANADLPIPSIPEGWHVEYIFAAAPLEDEPYEVTKFDNGYCLYKYDSKDVAEGDWNHYRFLLNDEDHSLIYGKVFPVSELESEIMKERLRLPDFSSAEAIEHPRFTDGRMNPARKKMDVIEYLFMDGDTCIYIHTDQNVPIETVLSLFPVE